MATPEITPLPPAPTRADGAVDFSSKADALAAAWPPTIVQLNAAFVWQASIWAQTQAARDVAGDSATDAAGSATTAAQQAQQATTNGQTQVTLAAQQADLSAAARLGAEAARDQSQVYAQAAQASTVPTPVPLRFLGTDVNGVVGWYLTGQKVGDFTVSLVNPGSTYVEAGRISYLQSAYPQLFSVTGLIPDADRSSIVSSTVRQPGENGGNASVADSGSLMVAFNSGSAFLYTSADRWGSWTRRTAPINNVISVSYGNGVFVAIGGSASSTVWTSVDGITWTQRPFSVGNLNWVLNYISGLFVAVPGYGSSSSQFATSPDGVTWTARAFSFSQVYSVFKLNGYLVAFSSNVGTYYYSLDGVSWTASSSLTAVASMAYIGGRYWAALIGKNTTLSSSVSLGGPWAESSVPNTSDWIVGSSSWSSAKPVAAFFTASAAVVSNDAGVTWVQRSVPSNYGVTFGNNISDGNKFFQFSSGFMFSFPFYSYDSSASFITPLVSNQLAPAKTYIKAKL